MSLYLGPTLANIITHLGLSKQLGLKLFITELQNNVVIRNYELFK